MERKEEGRRCGYVCYLDYMCYGGALDGDMLYHIISCACTPQHVIQVVRVMVWASG